MALHQQADQAAAQRRFEEYYERYVRLLEANHRGEYAAVARDGQTVLGPTLGQVAAEAARKFGPGSFLYKVGQRAAGRLR